MPKDSKIGVWVVGSISRLQLSTHTLDGEINSKNFSSTPRSFKSCLKWLSNVGELLIILGFILSRKLEYQIKVPSPAT